MAKLSSPRCGPRPARSSGPLRGVMVHLFAIWGSLCYFPRINTAAPITASVVRTTRQKLCYYIDAHTVENQVRFKSAARTLLCLNDCCKRLILKSITGRCSQTSFLWSERPCHYQAWDKSRVEAVLTYWDLSSGAMLTVFRLSNSAESKSWSPALEWTTLSFTKMLTARNMKETNRCMWM